MLLQTRKPSVAESILNAQQILITGASGTGKTTLAHTITQWRQRQFKGTQRTIFDPTFSWNQHIWLQSVALPELHQEQFVAGGGGEFYARFWDTFKALESSSQDALHTLVFDEFGQWSNVGFTREELLQIGELTGLKARHRNLASIFIVPSVTDMSVFTGANIIGSIDLQQAVVLELLPHRHPHGMAVPSVSVRYSPVGGSTKTAFALSELTLESML